MRKKIVQILALLLVCVLMVPLVGTAADPGSSDEGYVYLDQDGNVIYVDANGNETIIGTGYVDENGVLIITGPPPEGSEGEDADPGTEEDPAPEDGTVTEDEPVAEPAPDGSVGAMGNPVMRIGIYYGSAGKQSVDLQLTTGDGFQFGYYTDNECQNFVPASSAAVTKITVTAMSGNGIQVTDTTSGAILYQHYENGTLLAVVPYSNSGAATVTKCGYPYYGSFRFERIAAYSDLLTIVNVVTMDDYLKGVVPYESSPSWPIEALKAQAVCARSYAMSHINSSHRRTYHFDLCDSDCCQVYRGVYSGSQASKSNQAVTDTSGITIQYEGEYCNAVYSSSNGGASESNVNVWGKDVPYLKGKVDPYEAAIADTIPNYNWSVSFTGEELQAKLIASGRVNCGLITEVRTAFSETGNVIELTFVDDAGKLWTVYNNSCRTFLTLRSLRYTVSGDAENMEESTGEIMINGTQAVDLSLGVAVIGGDGTISYVNPGYVITADGVTDVASVTSGDQSAGSSGNVFVFTGTGWGHNVGLSQYGACAMAQMGYTYQQILEFYYTGVTIG